MIIGKYKGGTKMTYKKERGITLIALVITIIVLLILAAVSIATLTGENGILAKAEIAQRNTDIVETKEQIKLELMGTFEKEKTNYTNQDVINAVEKITGNQVTENTEIIKSKKGNDIDISDLWVKEDNEEKEEETKYYFTINGISCYFTDKDAGFQYDQSGRAKFYYDEWLNNHVSGVQCNELGVVTVDGEMIDWIDYHGLHSDGDALSLTIDNIERRIHY